jgi:hypothetical protein
MAIHPGVRANRTRRNTRQRYGNGHLTGRATEIGGMNVSACGHARNVTTKAPAAPKPFPVGTRVVARRGIGLLRPRVPEGTAGVVAGYSPAGEVEVEFANGRVELLPPSWLTAA